MMMTITVSYHKSSFEITHRKYFIKRMKNNFNQMMVLLLVWNDEWISRNFRCEHLAPWSFISTLWIFRSVNYWLRVSVVTSKIYNTGGENQRSGGLRYLNVSENFHNMTSYGSKPHMSRSVVTHNFQQNSLIEYFCGFHFRVKLT